LNTVRGATLLNYNRAHREQKTLKNKVEDDRRVCAKKGEL